MACYYPVGVMDNDGITTVRPCGMCLGCRLDRSRDWAIRCHHEAQMHDENSFVTLTYNKENLPEDGSVNKKELTKFIKRLRKEIYPKRVRFFGCGEYGEKLNRPHYHVCLFGHSFDDKEILFSGGYKQDKKGGFRTKKGDNSLYRSKELEKVWDKGFSTIGEMTYESAAYVARYVCKKFTQSVDSKRKNGDKYKEHYGDKKEEFALMSRMPGLGKKWFDKYMRDVYPKDYVTVNGIKHRPPRYYDSLLEKYNMMEMREIRKKRREKADKKRPDTTLRNRDKEYYKQCITKTLQRGYENGAD